MRAAVVDRWRFDRKVVWSPTCLWWVGAIGDDGYGRFASGTGPGDERPPLAVGTRRRTATRRGAATALL